MSRALRGCACKWDVCIIVVFYTNPEVYVKSTHSSSCGINGCIICLFEISMDCDVLLLLSTDSSSCGINGTVKISRKNTPSPHDEAKSTQQKSEHRAMAINTVTGSKGREGLVDRVNLCSPHILVQSSYQLSYIRVPRRRL